MQDADTDALVLELVQAKTAEAVAKQEAEEAKAKLEGLRKMLGMSGESPGGHRVSPSQPNLNLGMGMGGYLSKGMGGAGKVVEAPTPVSAASAAGGFWGWGKRATATAGEKVPAGHGG